MLKWRPLCIRDPPVSTSTPVIRRCETVPRSFHESWAFELGSLHLHSKGSYMLRHPQNPNQYIFKDFKRVTVSCQIHRYKPYNGSRKFRYLIILITEEEQQSLVQVTLGMAISSLPTECLRILYNHQFKILMGLQKLFICSEHLRLLEKTQWPLYRSQLSIPPVPNVPTPSRGI